MKLFLKETHPDLFSQLHPSLNTGLVLDTLTAGSGRSVWWLGECEHEWQSRLQVRTSQGSGCPYCSGQKVLAGFNDLSTTHPEIASQWHPTKNGEVTPSQVIRGSRKKVWWLGECGHEWEASIDSRTIQGSGCSYCSGNKTLPGLNDFKSKYPILSTEWHPTKNGELKPSEVSPNSHKKVWWLGVCGHEWNAEVSSRVAGKKCPYCNNFSLLPGFNDIATKAPLIALEWHPTKNNELKPEEVMAGSKRKVWWQCKNNHEWEAYVYSRTNVKEGRGCPQCWATLYVSKAETEIYEIIRSLLPEDITVLQSDRKLLKGQELDVYVPDKNLAFEFNGLFWHAESAGKNPAYHHDKWLKSKQAGVQLIQIWEDDWKRNPELVKRMLAHKLEVSQERRVYARKTVVVELEKKEAEAFLNSYHIQGFASGSHYVGLKDENDVVVSILVLKKEAGTDGKTLNIIRYAMSANVVGGFTKLLKHAERVYSPEKFITFADHTVSDGGLYENNGFAVDKILPPDYMYVVKGERKHKFGYRIKRFKDDPALLFEEGLTEKQLAELNGLERIWDAGKTRYVKYVN